MDFWERAYSGKDEGLPWFSKMLDGDIEKWLKNNPDKWKILSIGEGPGTQAIALAKLGFEVTGTDISKNAIRSAEKRAAEEKAPVRFIEDDILETNVSSKFSLIVDRGCFHVLPPEKRQLYIKNVSSLLQRNGFLLVKTFSSKETQPGPYRFSANELKAVFKKDFDVLEIKETVYEGTLLQKPKALFAVMRLKK